MLNWFLLTFLKLGKDKFHKSQHFDYTNGVPMMIGAEKPGIGGELLLGQKATPKYSLFPKGEGSDAPAWVAFDKQVCHHDRILSFVPKVVQNNFIHSFLEGPVL